MNPPLRWTVPLSSYVFPLIKICALLTGSEPKNGLRHQHNIFFSVLSGIKNVNVELEPGFQSAQKRDNGKNKLHVSRKSQTNTNGTSRLGYFLLHLVKCKIEG